jgi:hypothetical protein
MTDNRRNDVTFDSMAQKIRDQVVAKYPQPFGAFIGPDTRLFKKLPNNVSKAFQLDIGPDFRGFRLCQILKILFAGFYGR